MNATRLTLRQVRYENLAFWRNPAAAFFTFVFPLVFLFMFTTIFSGDTSTLPSGVEVGNATYYTASILSFSVVTACYTNNAMSIVFTRDEGILKRVRGTPLPPSSYLGGRLIHSVLMMVLLVTIVCAVGWIVHDIDLPGRSLPAFVVTLVVGAATFSALALACTAFIPNAEAAPAIVNATVLPLLFISGVFVPVDDAPQWLQTLGDVFPIKPFLDATIDSFLPGPDNPNGWAWGELAVVAAWGAVGLAAALRFFTWEPRR